MRRAFWVNFVLPLAPVLALPAVATALTFPQFADHHMLVFGAAVMLLLLALGWQTTGVIRSVDAFLVQGGDRLWAITIQGLVLIILLYAVLSVTEEYQNLQQRKQAYVASMAGRTAAGYQLVPLDDRSVRLTGSLDVGVSRALGRFLDQHPSVNTVELDSVGGRVYEGRALFKLIRKRGLNTRVITACYSSCAMAFLGGARRSMSAGALIGFHQYRSYTVQSNVNTGKEQGKDMALIQEQGLSEAFTRRMFSTKSDGIWIPDRQELIDYAIITE